MNYLKIAVVFSIVAFNFNQAYSQEKYYVTIGVFKYPSNADRLEKKALQQGYAASQALNAERKLHYVFVAVTSQKRAAYAQAIKLRVETEYKDAWVFEGDLGDKTTATPEQTVAPAVEEKQPEPIVEKPAAVVEPPITNPEPQVDSSKLIKQEVEKPAATVETPPKPKGKPFYFKLKSSADNKEVKWGEVHLQEGIHATEYVAFKPNELVYVDAPANKRGTYNLITQVAGFKSATLTFNYQRPIGKKGAEGEFIIEIPIEKAKKGDYVDFNSVRFYKDASIMYAQSQNELDGLVDLMKENKKYVIKIHGHVNGNQSRDAFTRGPNSSFFALNATEDVTTKGMSARTLSLKMAETVRDYLISQGIESKRISVKGEGGKLTLYPEGGNLAQYNDRVEIEFLKVN
jgi:outer membrane protein OmpA-like peptidoglycan-associated protein